MKNVIKIRLFGSVQLTNDTASICENQIHSHRLLTLLAYLIVHRDDRVPNGTLYKQFIGEKSKNPAATLKNLMYRLRTLLKALGDEEYICTLQDEYRWNPEIPVEVDYEHFEELHTQILAEQDPERKKDLCIEAIECYNGNFSPEIAEERWTVSSVVQNQTQYIEIVNILGKIYEKERDWEKLEALCRKALALEPFEEDFHSLLIRSLRQQNKFSQAMEQYESAKKIFYENFGVWDQEKLRASFERETQNPMELIMDLSDIQEEFMEKDPLKGAFFCDYQSFQQIYRVEVRRAGRVGISEYILLLTVRRWGGLSEKTVIDAGMTFGMEVLEKSIRKVLRMGDVVTRGSQTQFLVLLSSCSYETGVMVAERIYKEFKKKLRNQKLDLRYELREIFSLQQQKMGVIGE